MLASPGASGGQLVRRPRFEVDSQSGRLVDCLAGGKAKAAKLPPKSMNVSNLVDHIKAASSKMVKMVRIAEILDDGVGVQETGGTGSRTSVPCVMRFLMSHASLLTSAIINKARVRWCRSA